MDRPRLGFICGVPRSGTTWMGRILNAHPKVAVFGETAFWSRDYLHPNRQDCYSRNQVRRLVRIQQKNEWQVTTGDDRPLPGLASGQYCSLVGQVLNPYGKRNYRATPKELFSSIASAVASRQGKAIAVEKTPGHLLFLDRIHQIYPDAPIVIMFREPFGFVASLIHRHGRGVVAGRRILRRFAYHPAIVSYLWRCYARSLIVQLSLSNTKLLVVDHAQLIADPMVIARAVTTHFGANPDLLVMDQQPVNSSFASSPRQPAPAVTSFWLRLLAGPECAALYPKLVFYRVTLISILVSWLALLPSAFLFFALYRSNAISILSYFMDLVRTGKNCKERIRGS